MNNLIELADKMSQSINSICILLRQDGRRLITVEELEPVVDASLAYLEARLTNPAALGHLPHYLPHGVLDVLDKWHNP